MDEEIGDSPHLTYRMEVRLKTEISSGRKLSDMPLTCTSCSVCPAQGCNARAHPYNSALAAFSRRKFVAGASGVVIATTIGSKVGAQESTPGIPPASAEACIALTPEQTEGPYYIDDLLLRDDITEGRPGIPLDLKVFVIDIQSCEHIPDAAVDIWHCDANGVYSGFGSESEPGDTWMRGVQLTDQGGAAEIRTIYPGWYVGRATHIHLKVHTGGTAQDGTYLGGRTAHTGQLYFDDEITDQVAQIDPYVQRIETPRTRNSEDGILTRSGTAPGSLYIQLTRKDEDDLSQGFTGTALVGVNSSD